METVQVWIGSVPEIVVAQSPTARIVEFEGEEWAELELRQAGRVEILYHVGGPIQFVVYVQEDSSDPERKFTKCSLHEATWDDLVGNGEFAALGEEAGIGLRFLTLEEGLNWVEPEPDELP